jgi:hypothetical protein
MLLRRNRRRPPAEGVGKTRCAERARSFVGANMPGAGGTGKERSAHPLSVRQGVSRRRA